MTDETRTTTSADGTTIAYQAYGAGPTIVIVGGATNRKEDWVELAQALADDGFTGVTYDRRGRGDSGDTRPFAVEREVEDLVAVIEAASDGSAGRCPQHLVGWRRRLPRDRGRRPDRHAVGVRDAVPGRGRADPSGRLHRPPAGALRRRPAQRHARVLHDRRSGAAAGGRGPDEAAAVLGGVGRARPDRALRRPPARRGPDPVADRAAAEHRRPGPVHREHRQPGLAARCRERRRRRDPGRDASPSSTATSTTPPYRSWPRCWPRTTGTEALFHTMGV